MKKILTLVFSSIVSLAFTQQQAQYASSFQNPYVYNPAAGGLASVLQLDLLSRLQWVGNEGPQTINFSGHSVIGIGNTEGRVEYNQKGKFLHARPKETTGSLKHVVGGKILSDKFGVFNRVSVYGSYAIHIPVNKEFNVGAGIGLGWSNYSINTKRVVLFDQLDDTYAEALGNSAQQHIFDANAGIVFYGKGLFFGASVTNALRNKAKFDNIQTESVYNRHYYLNLAYGLKMGEKSILEPGVIAKFSENAPATFDFGARFLYNNALWVGVYGRTSNNIVMQFGMTLIENIYLSYSYEHAIGKIKTAASGTHEIQLGIYVGKRAKKIANDEMKSKKEAGKGKIKKSKGQKMQ